MPVISVIGTKGGVGKSTVAMGLATWLSKMQNDLVLLIDGDIHVRTIELKMCPKTDITFAEVLEGKHELVDAIYRCQLKAGRSWLFPNLSILPAGGRFLPPGGHDIEKYVIDTVDRFDSVMQNLREYFAYIIVDTPASVKFEHFILTSIADGLLFVMTPDVVSVFSSRQTAAGLKEIMDVPTVGTVLNKVPRGMKDLNTWIDYARSVAPVIGVIEEDELVEEAFNHNLPVVAAYPRSDAALAFKKIAKEIMKKNIKTTRLVPKFKKTWTTLWAETAAVGKRKRKPKKK